MKHSNDRRKRFYSFPILLKYTVGLTLISGFMNLVMIFVMAWFIQRNYTLFMGDELGVSAQVIELVRREQRLLELSLFLLFLGASSVTFAVTFFVIRKLLGPVAALERHLILFTRGDWTREFRLRHDDEFKNLEKLVNTIRENHISEEKGKDSYLRR